MSAKLDAVRKIENLSVEELINVLENNGFGGYESVIRENQIDGKQFLKLSNFQVATWKRYLGFAKMQKIWSFIAHIQENPEKLVLRTDDSTTPHKNTNKESILKKSTVSFSSILYQHYDSPASKKPVILPKPSKLTYEVKHEKIGDYYDDEGYLKSNLADDDELNIYEPEPCLPSSESNKYKTSNVKNQNNSLDDARYNNLTNRPLPEIPGQQIKKEAKTPESSLRSEEGLQIKAYENFDRKSKTKPVSTNETVLEQKTSLVAQLQTFAMKERKSAPSPTSTIVKRKALLTQSSQNIEKTEVIKGREITNKRDVQMPYSKEQLEKEHSFVHTDRNTAQKLLEGFEDGTYLIRQSSMYFCTLTLTYKQTFYNVGIEQDAKGMLKCISKIANSPSFCNIQDLINYYSSHPVVVIEKETNKLVNILLRKSVRQI